MNLRTISKLFGLGLALVFLTLAGANSGRVGLAQTPCTVTLSPGQSIQSAIDRASPADVICLEAGEWFENLIIRKSLTLRSAGQEKTKIKGAKEGYPVIQIESDSEIEVNLEALTIAKAKGDECAVGDPQWICPDGLTARGKARVTITNSTVSGNLWGGLRVGGSANVSLQNSTFSENRYGLFVGGSANVSLQNSTFSGNRYNGLEVRHSAKVSLQNSTVLGSLIYGLNVSGSAKVSLQNSTVSWNGHGLNVEGPANVSLVNSTVSGSLIYGLNVSGSAKVSLQNSTVSENRHGLFVGGSADVSLEGNKIYDNKEGYGVMLFQQPCYDTDSNFNGAVRGKNNEIYNNTKGNVCPAPELNFLMTGAGGCYGPKCK